MVRFVSSIELGEPLEGWAVAKDQDGVEWLTCEGLPILNLAEVFKRVAAGAELTGIAVLPPPPRRWPIDDHAARPGPLYWDFKCTVCSGEVRLHAPFYVRWWRRWRQR